MHQNKLKTTVILVAIAASAYSIQSNASAEKNQFYYTIGGGKPIGGAANNTTSITVLDGNIGLNSNLTCNGFDPNVTVSNQLNGMTEGFHNMMGDMLSQATAAITSLPGAILQRTNPEIYDMLQNGVVQGKVDFNSALQTCEDMQKIILDSDSPGEAYGAIADSVEWKEQVNSSNGDIIRARNEVGDSNGNNGLPWYDGSYRGGYGQAPIQSVRDTVAVGYNLLLNRDPTYTSAVSSTHGRGKPLWEYWKSPGNASVWVTEVVGEVAWRTCEGCNKTESVPGKGLTYFYDETTNEIEHNLQLMVDGDLPTDLDSLNKVSAPPSLMVRQEIIHAIRLEPKADQPMLVSRIAGEVALTRTFEQGVLAKRMLSTGRKEPNIANIPEAQSSVQKSLDELTDELKTLVEEMELRKKITGNTLQIVASRYISRRQKAAQETSPQTPSNAYENYGKSL